MSSFLQILLILPIIHLHLNPFQEITRQEESKEEQSSFQLRPP